MKLPKTLLPLMGLLLAATCSSPTHAAAADWPQWRGYHRDDKSPEKGLLQSWPDGGPPLAWKTSGLGAGFATVAVEGDHIFTAGDKGTESFVIALNRKDGSPAWAAKLGKAGAPGWGGFAGVRGTPTVDGDRIIALGQYGELVCLEKATGKEVWRKNFTADFGGKVPEWGFSESPLIDGEQVVCLPGGTQGAVVALNKKTGDLIWQTKDFTDDAQYSSLVPAEIHGVKQYIGLTMASVFGVSSEGKLLWKAARKGATAVIPTPLYHDGHVYVTSGYGTGCNLFKITKTGDQFTASQVYANKVMKNHHGGVVLVGDKVYGHGDYAWVCQDFMTGASVWESKDLKKGSIVYADGCLYLREEDKSGGLVALIEATPAGFKILGKFKQPDASGKDLWPHPVVADGQLYLRDQDNLLVYDIKKK